MIDDPRSRILDGNVYRLSIDQAKAILDLRLQRLTALGRDEIGDELKGLADKIGDYLDILGSRARVIGIVRDELIAIKEEFATPRRTRMLDIEGEVEDEDLIQKEDMVVTVSHRGYITSASRYRLIAHSVAAARAAPCYCLLLTTTYCSNTSISKSDTGAPGSAPALPVIVGTPQSVPR